ncbi:hypothetical protein HBE96_21285 [Clostridium sp. P21]|uniref:Uncharacterized protein n=1 Tax=Clostridium muellerianum TaxID=2716538 RepID=A0A7Y0EKM0_9CLOT|nr:hypothetical protein [Clostridium muellerianum]NMM65121.1 hypothetical protein [Clostridium muellerianum]
MEMNNNSSRILSLEEMMDITKRPSMRSCVEEGMHKGAIDSVVLKEVESKFSGTGKRIVLNIKVIVEDEDGKEVALYLSPNFTWSTKGKMIKVLQDLECLPEAGERLDIDAMVGMKVKVVVENTEKDGIEYSNIISMKRAKESKVPSNKNRKIPQRKTSSQEELEELNELDDMGEDFEIEE